MNDARVFALPDVGEGLVEAEIVSWKVKPGDAVQVNDVIVEIETAKSLVELPCPYAGTVGELLVPEGQLVAVGTPIIRVDPVGRSNAAAPAPAAAAAPAAEPVDEPVAERPAADNERTSVLVGYGPRTGAVRRRARKSNGVPPAPTGSDEGTAETKQAAVLAKPPVRKLAKDLGVDLRQVAPSGPDGTISRYDVEAHAAGAAEPATPAVAAPALRGEQETRVPVRGIRRTTAQAVTKSAFTAPHVTEWVTVDASAAMDFVTRLKDHRDFRDVKISPLVVVAKACCLALRRTLELNATWDDAAQEIVLKHYVNLGIAAATPRGLVVPHVKDADRLALPELARALGELTRTAREGKTQAGDMLGTTFTITNVGVFGVDGGTPIMNPGESGILAFGAIRKQPWVVDDQVVPRWVTTLSLSFDHRMVDGEQGSRFLTDVAGVLEDPASALLLA